MNVPSNASDLDKVMAGILLPDQNVLDTLVPAGYTINGIYM